MQVFLSYAAEDRELADEIQLALGGAGCSVFFDRNSLLAGGEFHSRIRHAIELSDAFVFLISPNALASGSYALTELKFAREKWSHPRGHVVPVIARKVDLRTIPAYLRAVTVLEPEGSVAAEVTGAVLNLQTASKPKAAKSDGIGSSVAVTARRAILGVVIVVAILAGSYYAVSEIGKTREDQATEDDSGRQGGSSGPLYVPPDAAATSPGRTPGVVLRDASFEDTSLGERQILPFSLPVTSDAQTWSLIDKGHTGSHAINALPMGNPQTERLLEVSSGEILFLDVVRFALIRVDFWIYSTSNPRPSTIHNCDSALNLYWSRETSKDWTHYTAICGRHKSESPAWYPFTATINTVGATHLSLRFVYSVQNSPATDPDAVFLIDDISVTGFYEAKDAQ